MIGAKAPEPDAVQLVVMHRCAAFRMQADSFNICSLVLKQVYSVLATTRPLVQPSTLGVGVCQSNQTSLATVPLNPKDWPSPPAKVVSKGMMQPVQVSTMAFWQRSLGGAPLQTLPAPAQVVPSPL